MFLLRLDDLCGGTDHSDDIIVDLGVGRIEDESVVVFPVPRGVADHGFVVHEGDLHAVSEAVPFGNGIGLGMIIRVSVKVLYKEDRLEILNLYLRGLQLFLGLAVHFGEVKGIAEECEVSGIPFFDVATFIMNDNSRTKFHGMPQKLSE